MTGEQKPFNLELETLLATPAGEAFMRLVERADLTISGVQSVHRAFHLSDSAFRKREILEHQIAAAYWNMIGTLGYTSRAHRHGSRIIPRHLYLVDILTYLGRE